MRRFCLLALLAPVLAAAPAASADLIEVSITGNIQYASIPDFTPGAALTFTLRYESDGPASIAATNANRTAFYMDHIKYARISSGSYDSIATGDFGQIKKYDYPETSANGDGIQFMLVSTTPSASGPQPSPVSFAALSNGYTFSNLVFNLSGPNTSWDDYALPSSYDPSLFTGVRNMSFGFTGATKGGGVGLEDDFTVTYTNLSVPEPASFGLLAIGGAALLRRRRR